MFLYKDFTEKCIGNTKEIDITALVKIFWAWMIDAAVVGVTEEDRQREIRINATFSKYMEKTSKKLDTTEEMIMLNNEVNGCFKAITKAMQMFSDSAEQPNFCEMVDRRKVKGALSTEVVH
jgi:hypothetical protein